MRYRAMRRFIVKRIMEFFGNNREILLMKGEENSN